MPITQATRLPLKYGTFTIAYHRTDEGDCVTVRYGDVTTGTPIVRIHSSCLFGESFHALDCECASQLASTLKLIRKNRAGVVVYKYDEGRGIGLENKIRALELQRTKKLNTVEAFSLMGFKPDTRTHLAEVLALQDLAVSKTIVAATQNPNKLDVLENAGFTVVEQVHPLVRVTKHNITELMAKKHLLGYHIIFDPDTEAGWVRWRGI